MMDYLRKSAKSSRWVYRRRVPADVMEAFGREWVEKSLKTADTREAKRKAAILTAELEAAWDALRGTSGGLERWRNDIAWVTQQAPIERGYDPEDPADLHHEAVDMACADLAEKIDSGEQKPLPGSTKAASMAYLTGHPLEEHKSTWVDALNDWRKERSPTQPTVRGATRVVGQFQALVGEGRCLDTTTRLQARLYRDSLVKTGVSPGSIVTYLGYLRTIFDHAMKENLIGDRVNPFAGLKVDKERSQEEAREPIPRPAILALLKQSLAHGFDQSDWFAAVLLTTGMRPIEAYGAKLVLEHEVPHWAVPRAKTSAPRVVPVHPVLLSVIRERGMPPKFTIRPEQLRRQFIERNKPFTAYQCRHSFKDETVAVGVPLELRLRLMGHSVKKVVGVNALYGASQVDLKEALKWVGQMWTQ